jgi:hypothetical protein
MAILYAVPEWFFGLDILLKIIFSAITLSLGLYSLKIYKITNLRETRLFGIGFILISLSYILKAFVNYFAFQDVKSGLRIVSLENLNYFLLSSTYLQSILFTTGLITLVYMTLKLKNHKIFWLLFGTNIGFLFLTTQKMIGLNFLPSMLLAYLCVHYTFEYQKSKNSKTMLVFLAFLGLLASSIETIIGSSFYLNYVITQLIELVSYGLILVSLILSSKGK